MSAPTLKPLDLKLLVSNKKLGCREGFEDGERVVVVGKDWSRVATNLFSTQEEADTRMFLHAVITASEKDTTVIRSDDTGVLIILLYYQATK